jgi:hypothetical protein
MPPRLIYARNPAGLARSIAEAHAKIATHFRDGLWGRAVRPPTLPSDGLDRGIKIDLEGLRQLQRDQVAMA